MSERKLYQVFRGLTDDEIKEFETYLRQDERPAGKRMWSFYSNLRRLVLLPDLEDDLLKKAEEKVARRLEESNENLDQAFRRWCTKLLKKLNNFLLEKEIGLLPEEVRDLLLLKAYERRALREPFAGLLKDFERARSGTPRGDIYYETMFRAYQLALEMDNPGGSRNKNAFRNVEPYFGSLDVDYLYHLVRINAFILNHNRVFGQQNPLRHPETMGNLAAGIERSAHPAIDIYLDLIEKFLHSTNEENIRQVVDKFRTCYRDLDQQDQYLLFGYCLNRVMSLSNGGMESMRRLVMDLYLFGIDQGLLYTGGKIEFSVYKNMVQAALALEDFSLAEKLMHEFSADKVWYDYEDQWDALRHLTRAKVSFARGEFDAAMSELNLVSLRFRLSDVYLEIDLRTLKVQLHYVLEQWEQGLSALDTMRMYVSNNSDLLNEHAIETMNWRQRWFRRLFRMATSQVKDVDKLIAELDSDPGFRLKSWIRAELKKLDGRS